MTSQDDPLTHSDDDVKIVPPDFALKKLVGENVDIKKLFSEENVNKVQNVIDEYKSNFLEWVAKDIATLEECYQKISTNLSGSEDDIKKLARTAFVIKSQAGTFGYNLATLVAKSLDDFCSKHPQITKDHLVVLKTHIDTLVVIFRKSIVGMGGAIGEDLLTGLVTLTKKFE